MSRRKRVEHPGAFSCAASYRYKYIGKITGYFTTEKGSKRYWREAPEYISSMLTYISEHHERQTRSTALDLLHIPRSHSAYFDRAFVSTLVTCTWNICTYAWFKGGGVRGWSAGFFPLSIFMLNGVYAIISYNCRTIYEWNIIKILL